MREGIMHARRWRKCGFAITLMILVTSVSARVMAQQYLGPSALVVAPHARQLYVACADAKQVLWVNLPKGNIQRRVDLPARPTGLVLGADGRHLFVTCAAPRSSIVQLDTATGEVMRTIPAGHTAVSPVLDHARNRLYVCNQFDNDVSIIQLSKGTELARVPVRREPIAAALTPDGRQLLVANHLPHRSADPDLEENVNAVVTAINMDTHKATDIELFSGASSLRGMCITADGRYAIVTHLLSNFESIPFRVDTGWINVNVVSIIDLRKMKTLSVIGLDDMYTGAGNPWGIACDKTSVWVTSAGTHQLSRISISELTGDTARKTMSPLPGAWPIYPSLGETLWHRYNLPGKGPRAIAVRDGTAYIAEFFTDTIAVVNVNRDGVATIRSISLRPPFELTLQRRGNLLFHDASICYQKWQSCASCHPDGRTDGLNWDLMNDGTGNPKSSKSLLLAHQTPPSMSKGVRATAEQAVRSGISHILFADRPEDESVAIDAYLKSLEPIPSPYLVEGQLNASARRGKRLFHSRRVACDRCHPPTLFTDLRTHRIGKAASSYFNNRFDTPTLVEVWRTAPYLHDGRFDSIEKLLSDGKHGLRPATALSDQEVKDLAEYVLSL